MPAPAFRPGLASVNISGAAMIKTAAGSRYGSQTIGVLFAGRAGSKGKSPPPSQDQRLGNRVITGSPLDRRPIVAFVVGVSPKEFPREFGRLEFV
jgi:hypothetical protein